MTGTDILEKLDRPLLDNRLSLKGGRLHLCFELGGVNLAYAYIRKNACSTFKKVLGYTGDTDVSVLAEKFPYRSGHDLAIFVYRDPIARIVSLYKNKIVDRVNSDLIFQHYREAMGEEPSDFEAFARFCTKQADPHAFTTRSHLMRLRYYPIEMSRLHEEMVAIVGEEAAEPFRRRENTSERKSSVEVSAAAENILRDFYSDDYELIRRIDNPGLKARLFGA